MIDWRTMQRCLPQPTSVGIPMFAFTAAPVIGHLCLLPEQADAVGRGLLGVGFVEGDPCTTVGARVLLALARVLETLLFELRSIDSAVSPYADVVLRCLVSLFLGEEGVLAVRVRRRISSCSFHKSRLKYNRPWPEQFRTALRTDDLTGVALGKKHTPEMEPGSA